MAKITMNEVLNQLLEMQKNVQTLAEQNRQLAEQNQVLLSRSSVTTGKPVHDVIETGVGIPLESDDHGTLDGFKLNPDGTFVLTGRLNKTGWLAGKDKKFVLNFSSQVGFRKFQELPNDGLLVYSLAIGYNKNGKK